MFAQRSGPRAMWGDARQSRDRRGDRFMPYYSPPVEGPWGPTGVLPTPTMPTVAPMYGAFRPDDFFPIYGQGQDVLTSGGAYGRLPARAGDYSALPQFVNQPPHARGPDLAPRPRDSDLWDQTLKWNRDNRGSCLTMTQEDKDGRIWGVDMSDCMVPWDILRRDTLAPHMEIIWDVNKRQFRCRLERN